MGKNKLKRISLHVCLVFIGCLYITNIYSQESLKTWEEQLSYLKDNPHKEKQGDISRLNLISYTYKGLIESDADKTRVIDSLLSFNTATILHLPPLVLSDTIATDYSYEIQGIEYPMFEIITMGRLLELYESEDKVALLEQIRKEFDNLIQIGFEFLELKWTYKNKSFSSICIVSNKNGGIIYEGIGTQIQFKLSTEKEKNN